MKEWDRDEMQMVRQGDESFGEYQQEVWDHIDWIENNTVKVAPKGKRVQAARAKDGLYWFENNLYVKAGGPGFLCLTDLTVWHLNGLVTAAKLEYWKHEPN